MRPCRSRRQDRPYPLYQAGSYYTVPFVALRRAWQDVPLDSRAAWRAELKARDLAWLALLVAVAAVLRAPGLSTGLWRDEGSTYFDSTAATLGAALHEIRLGEINPPGYFLLMRGWLALAGTSDLTMRLPSYFFGIALVPATYLLGRCAGVRGAGFLAAAFATFSTLGIDLSTDARPYTCAAFLAALATSAAFLVLRAEPGERIAPALLCYVAAAVVLEYVQYTGLVLAFGLTLGALGRAFEPRVRPFAAAFTAANVAVAAAFLPWLPVLLSRGRMSSSWLEPIGRGEFFGRLLEQFGFVMPLDFMRVQYSVTLLAAFVVAVAVRRTSPAVFAAGVALVFALTVETFALLREPRYVFVFTPVANVLVAVALGALYRACAAFAAGRPRELRGGFAAALGVLVAVSLAGGISGQRRVLVRAVVRPERSGMRALVAASAADLSARALIVVAPDYLGPSLGYYLRDRPDAQLMGFANRSRPEHFRCCDAWHRPALVPDAERAILARSRAFDRIAFVYDPSSADRGTVPFSRVLELRARLERDLPVLSDRSFEGNLEPAAITVFAVPRRYSLPRRSST